MPYRLAIPHHQSPYLVCFMGWVVGFEPTYTGATTLGLNHLTIPTMSMLVNFVHYRVVVSFVLGYVHKYVPFDTHSTRLVLRKISCAYLTFNFVHCYVAVSLVLGYVHRYVPFGTRSTHLALRKISCAYLTFNFVHYRVVVSFVLGYVHKYVPFDTHSTRLALRKIPCSQKKLATWNGLEPSTSSVTGWHSNQLNYQAANGGSYRARTCDPLLVRQMLSQLS